MRRLLVPQVTLGPFPIPPAEAHHARNVLRLQQGAIVEVFDNTGRRARATITRLTPAEMLVEVESIDDTPTQPFTWTIASAIPKGARVDWMIEKLSELGTARFIPLHTARSIVLPEGKGKRDRWERLAAESAKQSRRPGLMHIDDLTPLPKYLSSLNNEPAWYLSTAADALPIPKAAQRLPWHGLSAHVGAPLHGLPAPVDDSTPQATPHLHLLIGPEGGWTDDELTGFQKATLTPISLGPTILRIETAAVAAAVIAASILAPQLSARSQNQTAT